MENDNLDNQEVLDDDIMQCRADILRSRARAKAKDTVTANTDIADVTAQISRDNPVKRADVTAARVNPSAAKKNDENTSEITNSSPAEKKIRIPQFEDLVSSENQVVEGLWETSLNTEPKSPPQEQTHPVPAPEEIAMAESQPAQDNSIASQEEPPEIGFELDPDNIVTDEEEQALFGESQAREPEIDDCQTETEATEEGLEALRRVVAEAKNQAQPEIDKLEDIEDIMNDEDIEQLPDEKASEGTTENIDDTETMNVTDLIEPTEDTDDFTVEDVQQTPDDDPVVEEPQTNNTMIPKFDLAEQILKEQRQVASKRRQRPARARNLNIMPIAGTVGQIIERAKKAVATAAKKNETEPKTKPIQTRQETAKIEPVDFDTIEIVPIQQEHTEPVLSVAACRVINESDRLNPFQEDIIVDIVSRDIAKFCGKLSTNCL